MKYIKADWVYINESMKIYVYLHVRDECTESAHSLNILFKYFGANKYFKV